MSDCGLISKRSWKLLVCCCVMQWNAPKPPDEICRVDRDNTARRECFCQNVDRCVVIRVVEDGGEDDRVADVKIRVAGRQADAFVEEGRRQWNCVNNTDDRPLSVSRLKRSRLALSGA